MRLRPQDGAGSGCAPTCSKWGEILISRFYLGSIVWNRIRWNGNYPQPPLGVRKAFRLPSLRDRAYFQSARSVNASSLKRSFLFHTRMGLLVITKALITVHTKKIMDILGGPGSGVRIRVLKFDTKEEKTTWIIVQLLLHIHFSSPRAYLHREKSVLTR